MSRTLFSAVRRGAALTLAAARNNCGGTECCSGVRLASRLNNCDASTDCCGSTSASGRRAFLTMPALRQMQHIRVMSNTAAN
ncbi:hypothetical protein F503_06603 [Ophiostoma piceae UAMH 11346]|uniref:Uncharacterized protein n=1 Tax=Ophiostoma piceae (strain UAMH 11346) TaxID=1262450 RepID=S3BQI3_OPHP1|nr:hypothetical protein F503_06603 [Ophiostoma piceae UAMH 11346]